jgi:hypothetical protein
VDFVSDAQRRAVFANGGECKKKKKHWRIKTKGSTLKDSPRVKILSRDEFDKHVVATGNTVSPYEKGLYAYKENTIYVNKDAVRGPEDLRRTLLHEEAHGLFGPDERKAEAYAVKGLLQDYTPTDMQEHERLMNAEMRLFHPAGCILKDPQTIPLEKKEAILRKDAIDILAQGELIKGGRADGIPSSYFDKDQISKGIKVESEHTEDPRQAEEITKDHLVENPNYYDYLEDMEKKMNAESRKGSLLKGENPYPFMAAPADSKNYKFRVEDHVIGAGTRVAIAKELPDQVDLSMDNVDDERGQHVVVHVKGKEPDIEEFRHKIVDLKNSKKLGKAADYEISPIEEDTVHDIETARTFDKLECEQMSTFVDSSLELRDVTKAMSGKIDGLTDETRGIRTDIQGMSGKLDVLPEKIAKAIKNS